MKTVLFVPGFKEDINSRDYKKTLRAIENRGYQVKFIDITWNRTTIKDWMKELNNTYQQYNSSETILAGFSFGAITAFMSSVERNPSALWLFSLSPYFNEDQSSAGFRQSWIKFIGHRRGDTFKDLSFLKLANQISSKILFFYGETELKTWPDITYRHRLLEKMNNTKEIFIPNAKHDVTSHEYIEAIINSI